MVTEVLTPFFLMMFMIYVKIFVFAVLFFTPPIIAFVIFVNVYERDSVSGTAGD